MSAEIVPVKAAMMRAAGESVSAKIVPAAPIPTSSAR